MRLELPNFVWRKSAGPRWFARNEQALAERTLHGHAIVERPGAKFASAEVFCRTRKEARELLVRFGGSIVKLPRDWGELFASRQGHPPIRVGRRLVIVEEKPPAAAFPQTKRVLVIPAGIAFGTGDHATTAMCLRLLDQISPRLPNDWSLLDAGTGSGILALAARPLGAKYVVALDNDPRAIRTAKQNAKLNGIRGLRFMKGNVARPGISGRFDVITANLFSELLIRALPTWKKHLRPESLLVLSGILRDQEPELVKALAKNRLVALDVRRRGKWIALLARVQKAS